MWIDTHCHLDAPEFDADRAAVLDRAREAGVCCVVPAVLPAHFEPLAAWAGQQGTAYALGTHPLYAAQFEGRVSDAVNALQNALARYANDGHLVAVGEIGLDFFVPELATGPLRAVQTQLYEGQLKLACAAGLPVILHVRKSADGLLKALRRMAHHGGIAHAFNGSWQQAQALVDQGFKLGFGGALTFDRALQLRALAHKLPANAIVLETDAPDIPPHWLYATAQNRAAGAAHSRNEPAQLPRIAQVLAEVRGMRLEALAEQTTANALEALPKLRGIWGL